MTRKRKKGFTLLIITLVLVIMSLFALSGMRNSDRESSTAGRSRNTTRTLAAADSGLQLALSRLAQSPPNLLAFDVDLADGANVQSRTRNDAGPKDLEELDPTQDKVSGYGMNSGAAVASVSRVFLVNATATAGGSTVELQAKLARSGIEETGY